MAGDENTYGFRKDDADALIASIGMGETETPGRRLGGGGGGDELFFFSMLGNMVTKVALAAIYEVDGANFGTLVEEANVHDPADIFSSLDLGDSGLCIRRKGRYYIIQAKCPLEYL